MRPCRAALIHPRCTRATLPRRSGTPLCPTCDPAASQWYTLASHVRPCRVAVVHPCVARATLPCRTGTPSVYPCAPASEHCSTLGVGGLPKIPPSGQLKIPPLGATMKEGVRARTGRIRDARREPIAANRRTAPVNISCCRRALHTLSKFRFAGELICAEQAGCLHAERCLRQRHQDAQ